MLKGIVIGMVCLALLMAMGNGTNALAEDCDQAERLFREVSNATPTRKAMSMLEEAVSLCPGHWKALNDLGLLHEQEGEWNKAEQLYQRAHDANPDALQPVAGLGDTAYHKGNFEQAAAYYRQFLEGLNSGKGMADMATLMDYQEEYQRKLANAEKRAEAQDLSTRGVVGRQYISDLLAEEHSRGFGGVRVKPRLALNSIHFDYDSAAIRHDSTAQIEEISAALNGDDLKGSVILIEGHTDSFGGADYNLKLSKRRAQSVKKALVARGVNSARLKTAGLGESRLLVPSGSKEAQAKNRRVELVNEGYLTN